jgi:tetratricopeptide (TPR) repeat protein
MAPEQFAGERVDARADQFAFCVVLYEGLYGQRPFAGKDHGQILRAIEAGAIRPPPPGRRAPRWLRRVIERGLSVEPAQRFPSLHALLDALDRGARRRNRWVAGGVLAAALAIAAVAVVAGPRRAPEDTCGGAGAEFDAVWSSTARGRLATSAASADVALGPKVAARVTGRLDELRASYREAAHRACVARELDHTWDDDLYHRSRLCLEGSLAAARDLLARPLTDRHTLGELVSIAVQLPSPERCARPTTLAASPFFGHGLVTGAGRVAVYDALDLVMGSHEPIAARKARVEALARAAELLDTPVLDARVELVRASLAYQDADFAAAQAGAERAFHAARASGDDPDAAQAATLLLRILGVEQTRFEAARPWLLEALAEADRKNGGGDAYLAAAAMSARQGQLDDAVAYAKKAVAQLEDVGETRSEAYAFALDQLASVLDEGGHSAEAVPIYRRAIALDTELAGADGPPLFQDETNLSLALAAIGDDRGAIASARHAVALAEQWQGVLPADSLGAAFLNLGVAYQNANQPVPAMIALEASNAAYAALPGDARDSLVIVLADLALVHKALGRYPEAAAEIQQALALYKDLGLEGSTDAAQAELTLGQILSDAGQCKDAIPVLREATASLRAHVPTGTGWVIGVSSLGPCLRDTGHAAEALAAADEAATALAGFPHPKHIEAEIRWQIAQALHAVGRDPARARAQAAEARALWVADDAGAYAREIGAVDDAVARWPR